MRLNHSCPVAGMWVDSSIDECPHHCRPATEAADGIPWTVGDTKTLRRVFTAMGEAFPVSDEIPDSHLMRYVRDAMTWILGPANRPESHPSPAPGREEDEIDTITNNPNVLEALERSGGAGTLEGRAEAMIERLGDLLPEPPEPGVDGLAKSIETLVRRYEEEFREANRLRDILNVMQEKEAQASPPDSPAIIPRRQAEMLGIKEGPHIKIDHGAPPDSPVPATPGGLAVIDKLLDVYLDLHGDGGYVRVRDYHVAAWKRIRALVDGSAAGGAGPREGGGT